MLKRNEILKVTFENGKEVKAAYKAKIGDLIKHLGDLDEDILAVRIDNEVKSFDYEVVSNCYCEYVRFSTADGERIYGRSLKFIFFMAVARLYKNARIEFTNKMDRDHFAIIHNLKLTEEVVKKIKEEMREIIAADFEFKKLVVTYDEAKAIYEEMHDEEKLQNLNNRLRGNYTLHECDGLYNYFYGALVPSTKYIKNFDIRLHRNGVLLILPEKDNMDEIKKEVVDNIIYDVYEEHDRLGKILGVENVWELNKKVIDGKIGSVIRYSEAIHDRKLVELAINIEKNPNIKLILIAGPSSSGKTTFAQKLGVQLGLSGKTPITISMDNYFKNRVDTPIGEDGKYDFECVEALEVELFNEHMKALIEGKEVDMPVFDFVKGEKVYKPENRLKLKDSDVLIVEGIHALNPTLSEFIKKENKYKIYISPIATLNLDRYTKVSSTDTRLIRRIVRDVASRGHAVEKTLELWENVRRGEEKYIFPYISTADYMFNTSLVYEQGVMKTFVQPLLLQVGRDNKYYSEARRLYEFLNNFLPIETGEIPVDSIIREFIGDGCFYR